MEGKKVRQHNDRKIVYTDRFSRDGKNYVAFVNFILVTRASQLMESSKVY